MNPTAQPSADVPASAQHPASMKLSDSERREIRQARKERMDARWREEAKPLSYSPSHCSHGRPRISITIDGPSQLSQSSIDYPLKVTVHYHSDENAQGTIVFYTEWTPLVERESTERRYTLYGSEIVGYDDIIRFRIGQPWIRPHEARKNPLWLSIWQESGWVEIAPGESKSFDVRLKLDYWVKSLELGKRYWFRYRGRECAIPHWRRGILQSWKGEMFDPASKVEDDQGIVLTASNVVGFEIVSDGAA